jgi:hypothetical protein
MIINDLLKNLKYNVLTEFEEEKKKTDLFKYKISILKANGFSDLVDRVPNMAPKFTQTKYDEEGLEEAVDVDDVYAYSVEDEKKEILKRAKNIEYLGQVNNTFEYCRTRCKLFDARLRNFNNYAKDNQMCMTDCLNLRFENNNQDKPNKTEDNKFQKTFVWLA